MQLTRPLLAVVLSSSLVLAACSDDPEQQTPDPTTGADTTAAPTSEPDGATATGAPDDSTATATAAPDAGTETAGPDGEGATAAPTTDSPAQTLVGGVVTIEEADRIAADLIGKAEQARYATGEERERLVVQAYNGNARTAKEAETVLRSVTGEPDGEPEDLEPTVLAISRAEEDVTKYIVAQTVPEGGIPRLHLIATNGGPDSFRIFWEADMLPGTELGQFERRSLGAPVVTEDAEADLAVAPQEALGMLGEVLDYPLVTDMPDVRTNGYAPEVRQQARDQAGAVAQQAVFTQQHTLRNERAHTIALADGSAISFAVLDRRSLFDVRPGMEVTPPEIFRAFVDDSAITGSARLDWMVFSAVHIPAGQGAPRLIAVSEQVVDAAGS